MEEITERQTHRYNRPMPAGIFECHVHPADHDAEVYVEVTTVFGSEAYPICRGAVAQFISDTEGRRGVRTVEEIIAPAYLGHICGVVSSR